MISRTFELAASNDRCRRAAATFGLGFLSCWWLAWVLLPQDTGERGILLCAIAGAGNAGIVAIVDRHRWWCSPATWFTLAASVLFVFRPIVDVAVRSPQYQLDIPIATTYERALELGSLGMVFWGLGYLMPQLFQIEGSCVASERRPVDERRLAIGVSFSVLVVLLLTATFVATNGGITTFLEGRTSSTASAFDASSGYLYTAPQWLLPIGLFLVLEGGSPLRRVWRPIGWTMVAFSQFLGILLGDRSYFLIAIFACAMALLIHRGIRPKPGLILALVPAVVVLGVVLPREFRSEAGEAEASSGSDSWYSFLLSDDFSMARDLALVLRVVPEKHDYLGGSTYVAALTRPVPRQLFPQGKPDPADTILNEQAIYPYVQIEAGFSYSFLSEPYLNFGPGGSIVYSIMFGTGFGLLSVWFFGRSTRSTELAIYYSMLVVSMLNFVRGNFGTDYPRVLFVVVPLAMLMLFVRGGSRTPIRGGGR